jgi:hypothetical protein
VDFKKSNEAEINTQDCSYGAQQHDKKPALQSKNSQKNPTSQEKNGVLKIMARTLSPRITGETIKWNFSKEYVYYMYRFILTSKKGKNL